MRTHLHSIVNGVNNRYILFYNLIIKLAMDVITLVVLSYTYSYFIALRY